MSKVLPVSNPWTCSWSSSCWMRFPGSNNMRSIVDWPCQPLMNVLLIQRIMNMHESFISIFTCIHCWYCCQTSIHAEFEEIHSWSLTLPRKTGLNHGEASCHPITCSAVNISSACDMAAWRKWAFSSRSLSAWASQLGKAFLAAGTGRNWPTRDMLLSRYFDISWSHTRTL